ncbi:MAG: ABC transporter ATP-binding protein [Clostridiales bacterium]|nr:ABC transporter ATP-binding protein [Clostridiales bacterium]
MFKRLIKCIKEYKLPTILTFVFIILEVAIEVFIPFITVEIIDNIEKSAPLNSVIKACVVLAVMACISLCCGGIAGFTSAKASGGFAKNLRKEVFSKIQTFSFSNIDKFSSSSLVTRLTTDIGNVQMAYMMLIRIAVRAPLMLICAIIMASIMGGKLALTFVVIVPLLAFGLLIIGNKAMPAFRSVFKKYDKLNESIEENVRGMRVVKGYSREEFENKKFDIASNEICKDFTRAERMVALNTPLMQICLYFNMIFVLIVGSMLIVQSGGEVVKIGHISAMLTYGMQILMQLMMLSMIYVILTMSAESIKRIDEVLVETPNIKEPDSPIFDIKNGSVEFKNVFFKYSDKAKKYALSNINLSIKSGETVGIIGGTGSSKSSLIQLISRLYDTTEGEVLVGGVNVKDYELNALRSSVAVVLQKNLLFSGTIKENLRWGNKDATDEELVEACKLACAHDFVMSFPDKYDTFIEQGGSNVSGGQKQRLCIARALLKKPKILILDDSTSAVDTKTDAMIRKSFKTYIPETTKIIIAQRVASVMDADKIIVMNNGEISAIGKHEELLKNSEIYREVYTQQIGGAINE